MLLESVLAEEFTAMLLWAILFTNVVVLLFGLLAIFRSKSNTGAISRDVREELRSGREESRDFGSGLREEVATQMHSSSESIRTALLGLGESQGKNLEIMHQQLKELLNTHGAKLDGIKADLDVQMKDFQRSNEAKLSEIRSSVKESLQQLGESQDKTLLEMKTSQQKELQSLNQQMKEDTENNQKKFDQIRQTLDDKLKYLQTGNETKLSEVRKEVGDGLKSSREALEKTMKSLQETHQQEMGSVGKQLEQNAEASQKKLEEFRTTSDESFQKIQQGNEKKLGEIRKEVSDGLKSTTESLEKTLKSLKDTQKAEMQEVNNQLKQNAETAQIKLDEVRKTFDLRIKEMQQGNEKKLEEMRQTVDEKLHDTLEKRLGESFKLVSERLDSVREGLGEMKSLATGVGDLKRVLSNVKVRGTWAEIQLGALLDQVLTADQYAQNVSVNPDSLQHVEFAIKLPGAKEDPNSTIWLPIDSKFPQEDYLRLQEAAELSDAKKVQSASNALAKSIQNSAKEIHEKYVHPPHTTDFAIMFLPTEGLYAEVLRREGLVEELQQKYRIVVAGPTNLIAILSSLQMGFQTLAIEQRASEVWKVLGAVKTEFGKFAGVLDKVQKQLGTASKTIEATHVRTRAMERKLKDVEQLPEKDADGLLGIDDDQDLLNGSNPFENRRLAS